MARSQVREVSGPSAIQAVAAPVNTYVRPADPAPSSLHQLAEGLSALDRGLGSFLDKRKEKTDEADKQRAIRDGMLANSEGYDEGTKRGLIPAQESPVYMEWYAKSQADVRGRALFDEASLAYQTWEGRNGGDPEAFKDFLGGFLRERVGDITDPHVLAGLNPHLERIHSELFSTFTTERSAKIKNDALSTVGAGVMDDIDRAEATGEIDYEALWGGILERREDALKRNSDQETDPFFIDSILLQAEESDNEDLLDLLDRQFPDKDHTISSDPEVRKKIMASRARIASSLASKATHIREEEERQDKLKHNALKDEVFLAMSTDETYVVPEATLKEISRRDPEFRTKIAKYRQDLEDGKMLPEDEQAIMSATLEVDRGAGKSFVNGLFEKGVIRKRETLNALLTRADQVEKSNAEGGILKDPTFKQMEDLIKEASGGPASDLFGGRGTTMAFTRAMVDFRTQLYRWETLNPDLTKDPIKRGDAILSLGQRILDGLPKSQVQERIEQGTYTPMSERDAKPDQTQQDGQMQQPQVDPQAAPSGPVEYRSETHQKAVNALATKHGMTEQEAFQTLEEFYGEEGQEEQPPATTEAAPGEPGVLEGAVSNLMEDPWRGNGPLTAAWNWITGSSEPEPGDSLETIPEDTKSGLMNLLQNPPTLQDGTSALGDTPVQPLLDLLGDTEGTDAGAGYNETLGYGKFAGGSHNLVGMTLDQVDALQTKMLSHPENTHNASPVGRYQIVRETLRGLRRNMGLSGDELFTPELQRQMAMELLKGRGLKQWMAGSMSDADFIANLKAEWTSLKKTSGPLGEVLGQLKGGKGKRKGVQVASLDPNAGFAEFLQDQDLGQFSGGDGPDDLVTSNKRGRKPDVDGLLPEFRTKVSGLQKAFGKALPIVSGHRDSGRNKKAGGARKSMHIHRQAVDIDVSGMGREDRIRLIQMARQMGFGGVGVYANSIHLDTGKKRSWGPSHFNDSLPKWARAVL